VYNHEKYIFLLFGIIVLILSCSRKIYEHSETALVYQTWKSLNEKEYGEPVFPLAYETPEQGFFPWAGIVSHHLLAHEYIDVWFFNLAQMRKLSQMQNPKTFFILSPDHFGVSIEPYSLTTGSWDSGFGLVESERETVLKLAELLGVGLDPNVFVFEHGVSTLMPYIKKYFPEAKVVTIAYKSEGSVNIPVNRRLADVLKNEFDETGKQENFLLISSDFSHGGNLEKTQKNDAFSKRYIKNDKNISWNMVSCDNRSGIYILDLLGKNNLKSYILYHTNSLEISGFGNDDITSYFFVYFGDRVVMGY
jgi:AmmeMemoRadiSam system protein B